MQDFFDRKLIGPLADASGLSVEVTTKIIAVFMMTAIVFSWYSIGGVLGIEEREPINKESYEKI